MGKKLYLIELLRFLSAASVVIYHYQIYFFQMNHFNEVNILENLESLPFNSILNLFYKFGDYGVHMFFCISGFIMSFVYLDKTKEVNAKKFFISRFSRLYPLHFITLIVVLFIQQFSLNTTGTYQLFNFNDLYHFILHLGLVSAWGFEKGMSFNQPIWSVSLEVICYFLFFICLTRLKKINLIKTSIFLVTIVIYNKFVIGPSDTHSDLISCLQLFLTGMVVFQLNKKFKKSYLVIFSIALLLLSMLGNFKIFFFCPAVLLIIVLFENNFVRVISKKIFSFFGNLTYSLYLWQTPFAIIFILIVKDNTDVFYTHKFFATYFVFLIILSATSYYFLEKKLQKLIKNIQ